MQVITEYLAHSRDYYLIARDVSLSPEACHHPKQPQMAERRAAQRRMRVLTAQVTATSPINRSAYFAELPDHPLREMTAEELEAFARDGVVPLRGVLPQEWVERIAAAVHKQSERKPVSGQIQKFLPWLEDDAFAEIALRAPTAHLAQQALNALQPSSAKGKQKEVRFFYDQIFVKWPRPETETDATAGSTPFHHDITFWPISGEEVVSIWIPLDRVDLSNGGLEFVPGSHRWKNRYKAIAVGKWGSLDLPTDTLEELPDLRCATNGHKVTPEDPGDAISWELGPGDALVFTSTVMHGAPPNRDSTRMRRGLALRYIGTDVKFDNQKYGSGTVLSPFDVYDSSRQNGDAVEGFVYPLLLPRKIPEEIERRAQGPILPVPWRFSGWVTRSQKIAGVKPLKAHLQGWGAYLAMKSGKQISL